MRRHVENQIESGEKGNSGILVLLMMWVLALMALSTAARGAEKPIDKDKDKDKYVTVARTGSSEMTTIFTSGAPYHLQVVSETATLTRFVLISIPDRKLALVDGGQVVKVYPIAVGTDHTPSPDGTFTIISRVANPTWSHKGKVAGPGKGNPVGSRWMGLSLKGYGIHGTNAPRSIGKAASHGCFRMGKKDVEELFALVKVGDSVAVRAERDDLVTQVFVPASNGEIQIASTATGAAEVDNQ
jgi:lipoprotein-anchoring transpeptidase ErfK/SrfK